MNHTSGKYVPEIEENTYSKAAATAHFDPYGPLNKLDGRKEYVSEYEEEYIKSVNYIDLLGSVEHLNIHEHFESVVSKGQKNDIIVESMMLHSLHQAFSDKDFGIDKNQSIDSAIELIESHYGKRSNGMFHSLQSTLAEFKSLTDPESSLDSSNAGKASRYREALYDSKELFNKVGSDNTPRSEKIDILRDIYENISSSQKYRDKFDRFDKFYDDAIAPNQTSNSIDITSIGVISEPDIEVAKRAIFKSAIIENKLPVAFDKIDELYDRIISDDYNTTDMSLEETRYFGFRTQENEEDQAMLNKLDSLTKNLNRIGFGVKSMTEDHKMDHIDVGNDVHTVFDKENITHSINSESKMIADSLDSIRSDRDKIDYQNDITLDDYSDKDTRQITIHPYEYMFDPIGFAGKLGKVISHRALKTSLGENGATAKSFVPFAPNGYATTSNKELGDYLDGAITKDADGNIRRSSFEPVDSILNRSDLNDSDKKNMLTSEIASNSKNLQVKNDVIARSNINTVSTKLTETENLLHDVSQLNRQISDPSNGLSPLQRELKAEEMARKMDKAMLNMKTSTDSLESLKRARPDFMKHYAKLEFATKDQLMDQIGVVKLDTPDEKGNLFKTATPLDSRFSKMSLDERVEMFNFYEKESVKNKLESLNNQASDLLKNTDLLDNYQRGKGDKPEAAQKLKDNLKDVTESIKKSMEDIAKALSAVFQKLGGNSLQR
jgi:hypothetical protein